MREIRFRGWDGEVKRMWSWEELKATHPLGCLYSHGDGSWEVMQFTGLHDKNDVEIYEGDIIAWRDFRDSKEMPERIGFIEFDYLRFRIVHQGRHYAEWRHYLTEVIGNIYQHQYLLKGEPKV